MALLTLRPMSTASSVITYTAASASDTFPLDSAGKTFIHIKNAGASPDNVAIVTGSINLSAGQYQASLRRYLDRVPPVSTVQ